MGDKWVYIVVSVWNPYGKPYLSMEITKESEVADTRGSTATVPSGGIHYDLIIPT